MGCNTLYSSRPSHNPSSTVSASDTHSAMRCPPHAWEGQGSVCPYGYAVAEVTWPFGENLHESDQGTVMFMRACAIWSTLPYIVYVFSVVRLCRFRGTRDFNFVFFVLFVSLLNQVVLKRLVHQMRPERSCLTSCGSPCSEVKVFGGHVLPEMSHYGPWNKTRPFSRAYNHEKYPRVVAPRSWHRASGTEVARVFTGRTRHVADNLIYSQSVAKSAGYTKDMKKKKKKTVRQL